MKEPPISETEVAEKHAEKEKEKTTMSLTTADHATSTQPLPPSSGVPPNHQDPVPLGVETNLKKIAAINNQMTNNLLQEPVPKFADGVKVDLVPSGESFCHDTSDSCDSRVNILFSVVASVGYPIKFANSWKGNDPCAGWLGISCDRDGNIVTVNFKKQNLDGFISPQFEELESLQNLDLSDNNLTGAIPPGLINLKFPMMLDVSNNDIFGKVSSFGNSVTVITHGNQNIGRDIVPGIPPGGGSISGSPSKGSNSGESSSRKKPSVVVIVGSVFDCIAVLGVLGLLGFCFLKKRRRNYVKPPNMVIHPDHSGSDTEMLKITAGDLNVVEPVNMIIKIQFLREMTNNFSSDNILGRGGFGTVYGDQLYDGTFIAVKKMETSAIGSKGTNEFKSEISVLTKVWHRHLVSLLSYCLAGNEKILVYEYMPQGTLSRHLFNWSKAGLKPLEWMRRLSIALDVARGVEYLHSLVNQTFIHNDLKPPNTHLGDNMRAKVADFGLVRFAPEGKHSVETRLAGTFGYLAPEYAVTERVTTKADVFSFGVILMEQLTGRKALDEGRKALNESQTEENIHLVSWFLRMNNNENTFPKTIDPTNTINTNDKETMSGVLLVSELASHCCVQYPHQRPDMGYAVNILSSLVEHWNSSDYDRSDDGYGIDLNLTLQQAIRQWQAKQKGRGRWSKEPGASELAIRNLPPSAIGDSSNFDAMGFLAANKGKPLEDIVEQVRDGSTVRVYLLPDFQLVQVFVAGIQAPSMGRRAVNEAIPEPKVTKGETNGEASTEARATPTSAQRLAASTSTEVSQDPFGREAKHFAEIRVFNRDVRIVLEGVDKFSNLISSVIYADDDTAKALALELVENGLAKYVEWSANMMEDDAKRKLRITTSGQSFPQCIFNHWDMMSSDPLEPGTQAANPVTDIRKRKGLKEQMTPLSDFEDKLVGRLESDCSWLTAVELKRIDPDALDDYHPNLHQVVNLPRRGELMEIESGPRALRVGFDRRDSMR